MEKIDQNKCFNGILSTYKHDSLVLGCPMTFSIFLPAQAKDKDIPVLTFLSGLTCTHENFTTKAGAYRQAAHEGIAIVAPDTSPRGDNIPNDEAYDFGQGAGFYIDATQDPWANNFKMESYIAKELNTLICENFPILENKQAITGHSMGGHGALTLGLKYPELYKTISAFAPIVAPSQVPWGEKAFTGYIGNDKTEWQKHDACALMSNQTNREDFPEILIDQGLSDNFLEDQLKPHLFEEACAKANQKLTLRLQEGYDHSYYFIQSFIEDHIKHAAKHLRK